MYLTAFVALLCIYRELDEDGQVDEFPVDALIAIGMCVVVELCGFNVITYAIWTLYATVFSCFVVTRLIGAARVYLYMLGR